MLDQWFSTFFSSRHTNVQKTFGGTLIPKNFVLYFKKKHFFHKRIGIVRNEKSVGTPVEKHCARLSEKEILAKK